MPRFTFVTFEQGLRTDSAVTGTVVVMLRRYPRSYCRRLPPDSCNAGLSLSLLSSEEKIGQCIISSISDATRLRGGVIDGSTFLELAPERNRSHAILHKGCKGGSRC